MEDTLVATVHTFIKELQTAKSQHPDTDLTLQLVVGLRNQIPKIRLLASFHDGTQYQNIKAESLDSLLWEVKRRLDFADRESVWLGALEESFVELPEALEDKATPEYKSC